MRSRAGCAPLGLLRGQGGSSCPLLSTPATAQRSCSLIRRMPQLYRHALVIPLLLFAVAGTAQPRAGDCRTAAEFDQASSCASGLQEAEAGPAVEHRARSAPDASAAPIWIAARRAGAFRANWPADAATLRTLVVRWAGDVGIRVRWESTNDYQLPSSLRDARFSGSFRSVLFQLAGMYGDFETPLVFDFLEGGTVLRVRDQPRTR